MDAEASKDESKTNTPTTSKRVATAADVSGLPRSSDWASKTSNPPVVPTGVSALESLSSFLRHEHFSLDTLESVTVAHEAFMLRRPAQTYIVRTLLEYVDAKNVLAPHVTAIDLGSSLTLSVKQMLYNIRDKNLGVVAGFAGSTTLKRVGDLIIPHPIKGSTILESALVDQSMLPSGTHVSIGRGGSNALNLKSEALAGAPPSIIPAPVFKHDKPDPSLNWGDFCVHGRDGLLHPVVWDGVLDTRIGERAFVLFQDGSTSLVQIRHLLWTKSKSPIFPPVPSNKGELTDALMMMASRDMPAYPALAKPLIDLVHTTPWAWSNLSDRALKRLRRSVLNP